MRCGLPHSAARACPVLPALPTNAAGAPLPPGALVGGRFRVEEVTHRSGMSTVYRAVDLRNHGMIVALKELNASGLPATERAEALTWLAREAGLLSTLHDPRLPSLLAAAGEGDRHYVAMPFLRGETLEERILREGPQNELLVLGWARELAALLRYLHGQDPPVIHRDLKPANVLLRPDGSLALLDLGVARSLARGTPGTAVGTPGYAPPEQYQGLADERSDLYALGATLHRALTGYNPHLEAPFRHPPVHELRPEASSETAALVERLLALAPAGRPAGAPAVLAGVQAATRSAFARAYRPLHVMYTRMLALLAVALTLGAVIYVWAFGLPGVGGGAAAYTARDPGSVALWVLAVFAPGLLPLLPLGSREARALARRGGLPRRYKTRAACLFLLAWSVPLVVWLVNVWDQRLGNLTAVPGHAAPAAGLAFGSALLAVGGLAVLHLDLRLLPTGLGRLSSRMFVAAVVAGMIPISWAWQTPEFLGSCYTAPVQGVSRTQFAGIQALGADQQGNLYVLDSFGLRERMADGRFHLLLNFNEAPSSPSRYSSPIAYTRMSVSPDGLVALGLPDSNTIFRLVRPGQVTIAAHSAFHPAGMVVGRGGVLYVSSPDRGLIDIYAPNHPDRPTVLRPHPVPPTWQPEAMTLDFQGNLYVVDLGTRSVERIAPDGRLTVVASMTSTGVVTRASTVGLTDFISSLGPPRTLYVVIADSPALIYLPDERIGERQPEESGISAVQIGDTDYVAAGYYLAAWEAVPGRGRGETAIGGSDPPSEVCVPTS
ncbi:MAG TPA: serine/threonine-protein kinase [Chloroflexota bacterium]|nr:serine/threonine-protein kinase [Chloroflexota bacterium]